MTRQDARRYRGLLLSLLVLPAAASRALAWQDPDPNFVDGSPPGMQVLTQGPIHEAFAEPIVYDPRPGPIIPRQPPQPIEEAPPAQQPVGANVQWIPGYWAWDDSRNDFLWVSGLWRDVPPGRQWVPGYWAPSEGGFRWVPGAWASAGSTGVDYLSAPPQSLENGPSSPPPSPDATWSPGSWVWQGTAYAWRPGFWVPFQPNWVWTPNHYNWSPGGYQFVDGYWDRPLTDRGTPFAPVYFSQPVYRQPNFSYTPTVGLLAAGLASSLFVRPSYHQYYFGDYYARNNFQSGIYPWYSFHQSRYGTDPLFAHYAATNVRRDPQFLDRLHEDYRFRREHVEARPPRTYTELRRFEARPPVLNNTPNTINESRHLAFARPIAEHAAVPTQRARYTEVNESRRREIAAQSAQIQQFREQRARQEIEASRARPIPTPTPNPGVPPAALAPQRFERARSPIAAPPHNELPGARPPAMPVHPQFQPEAIRQRPPGEFRQLPVPHPEMRPQPFPQQNLRNERPAPPRPAQRGSPQGSSSLRG